MARRAAAASRAIGKVFQRIQGTDEFLEPFRPPNRSPFDHPIKDMIGVGPC